MTDLLDLHSDPPAPRSRRAAKRGPGRWLAVLVVLLLTAGLVGGGAYAVKKVFGGSSAEDFSGEGSGEIVVQIEPGSTAGDIGGMLAEEGVITVVAIVDADTGLLAEPPDFLARGFVHDQNTFTAVVPLIEKALARAAEEGVGGAIQLEQQISRAVQNWAHRTYRRSPMIIPVVIDA